MTVYNWIKVKLLYYCSIKEAFQCFLQFGNVYFSSWDIIFFITSIFKNLRLVSGSNFWYIRNETDVKCGISSYISLKFPLRCLYLLFALKGIPHVKYEKTCWYHEMGLLWLTGLLWSVIPILWKLLLSMHDNCMQLLNFWF